LSVGWHPGVLRKRDDGDEDEDEDEDEDDEEECPDYC
jgi:hypothetical protein